jgi:hypothetical protein
MAVWISRALKIGAAMFVLGWILVLVSGHTGSSSGGSEVAWRIGGVLVYVAVPTVVIAAVVLMLATMLRRR